MIDFVCYICGREFDNAYSLGSHVGWHTNGLRVNPLKILVETRTCAAPGCDNTFDCKVNSERKYCCGGHNKKGRKIISREARVCACGCGETFEAIVTSKQRYINGHNRRKRVSIETRTCECGCEETFECKIDSKQRYISGHNQRGKLNIKLKIVKVFRTKWCECGCGGQFREDSRFLKRYIHGHNQRGKTYVEIYGEDRASDEFCKRLKSMQSSPNIPEMKILNILKKMFPGGYKYVGNGEVLLGGRCPDFVSTNGKKIIELFGDYWHGESYTGISNVIHEQQRKDYFKKYGYQTLIIWEHELQDERVLMHRIKEFDFNMGSIK